MSKRSRILLALPFVIAIGVAGCGESNPSAPGDTVAPAAVLDLGATLVSVQEVQVNWTAGTEADLVGYNVYRSTNGQTEALVGVVTTNSYNDDAVQRGSQYRYAVSSVDGSGNESARVSSSTVLVWNGGPVGRNVRD